MKTGRTGGRAASNGARGRADDAMTARPVADDGSPVAAVPATGVGGPGAPGLFSRARAPVAPAPEALPARLYGPQHTFENRVKRGLGWLRDTPDLRDFDVTNLHEAAGRQPKPNRAAFKRVKKALDATAGAKAPAAVDNRRWCSPVEDQGRLGSCTAHACIGLVEYMERRACGAHTDSSRLFLYKATRKLLGWTGDTGAFLRTTMKALVNFGVPPEEVWPYEEATFDQEPDPFMYAYAANTKAIQYLRLDPPGHTPAEVLRDVKQAVALGYAVMFGFSVYSSLGQDPDIPFPARTDRLDGGHAILIVGYDDARPCREGAAPAPARKGAFRIRNSWGQEWGEGGYGWLPYDYLRAGLADDFWTCFKLEWVESNRFD